MSARAQSFFTGQTFTTQNSIHDLYGTQFKQYSPVYSWCKMHATTPFLNCRHQETSRVSLQPTR
jgi:hypothetical protein